MKEGKERKIRDLDEMFGREYFEDGTTSNFLGYSDNEHFKLLATEIVNLFKPKKVLDVGCAKGYFVKYLRKLGVEAYGVDISNYAISEADSSVKKFLKVSKAQKLPFLDNEFDLVYTFDVLEHITEDDLDATIKELARVGNKQFHVVTYREFVPGKDKTHVTLMPMNWWHDRFSKYFEDMDKVFLVESYDYWIYDYLADVNRYQAKIIEMEGDINSLKQVLSQKDLDIQQKDQEIAFMKGSKFWKLRDYYTRLRGLFQPVKRW